MRIFYGNSDVPAVLEILRGLGVELAPPRQLRRTWLDTFDHLMRDAEQRLEFVEGRESAVILSEADTPPAQVMLDDAPRFARDLPPGPFRERIEQTAGPRALLPIAVLAGAGAVGGKRTHAGKTVARVTVLDRITIDGKRADTFPWAVEIDPVLGYDGADDIAEALHAAGLVSCSGDAFDLAAALNLLVPASRKPAARVSLSGGEPAIAGFRRVLLGLLATIEANLDGVVNDIDSEFLHDLRVATRRTRSVLANAKRVLPEDIRQHFVGGFHRLAAATGEARDLDVAVLGWDDIISDVSENGRGALTPVYAELLRRQTQAHKELARVLRSASTRKLLSDWRQWLETDVATKPTSADDPMRRVAAKRLRRIRRRLAGDSTASIEERHAVRKAGKQLRYLVDCFGDLYDTSARKSFTKKLADMQERLGLAQDANAQIEILDLIAGKFASRPDTLRAIGEVTAILDRRRSVPDSSMRRLFSKAADKRFRALLESSR